MNCEQANNLISARIDGELPGDDAPALDAHLAECESCRQALVEMERGDAALLRAFSPGREAAAQLANRVSQVLSPDVIVTRPPRAGWFAPGLMRWAGIAAAAAAGFMAALCLVDLRTLRPVRHLAVSQSTPLQPVARLTLATGAVFTRPVDQRGWQEISSHDPIDRGATIRTGQTSKCELELPDGSCVRLNCGTEARFTDDRSVQVSAGQLWSALPRNAATFRVSTGATGGVTTVAARGAADRGTEFDFTCVAGATTVAVQCGTANVSGNIPTTTVHRGQILHAPSDTAPYACTATPDPLLVTQWQDDLLVLKPADDPRVLARIDQLMARIVTGGQPPDRPCSVERDLRGGGQAWCSAMACYLRNPSASSDSANRRAAARILTDLAPPSSLPDLIDLLADEDGEIRSRAAGALQRLTGQTLGFPPDRCAAHRDLAACAAWRDWSNHGMKK